MKEKAIKRDKKKTKIKKNVVVGLIVNVTREGQRNWGFNQRRRNFTIVTQKIRGNEQNKWEDENKR